MASRMGPFASAPTWTPPPSSPPPAPSDEPSPPSSPATPGASPLPQSLYIALPAMMGGVLAAAAIWMGLAVLAVSLAWWRSMSSFTLVASVIIGACLLAAGAAYVLMARPKMQAA